MVRGIFYFHYLRRLSSLVCISLADQKTFVISKPSPTRWNYHCPQIERDQEPSARRPGCMMIRLGYTDRSHRVSPTFPPWSQPGFLWEQLPMATSLPSSQGTSLQPKALPPQGTQGSRGRKSINSSQYWAALRMETPGRKETPVSPPLLAIMLPGDLSVYISSCARPMLRLASQAGLLFFSVPALGTKWRGDKVTVP